RIIPGSGARPVVIVKTLLLSASDHRYASGWHVSARIYPLSGALRGLALARDELGEEIIHRLRVAFDDLFRQLRLMAEVEAERRQWFSSIGLDLTLRILMGMVVGAAAYDWILLPEEEVDTDQLVGELSKVALWGLERTPHR